MKFSIISQHANKQVKDSLLWLPFTLRRQLNLSSSASRVLSARPLAGSLHIPLPLHPPVCCSSSPRSGLPGSSVLALLSEAPPRLQLLAASAQFLLPWPVYRVFSFLKPLCTNQVIYFLYFKMLWHLEACRPGEGLPFPGLADSRLGNNLPPGQEPTFDMHADQSWVKSPPAYFDQTPMAPTLSPCPTLYWRPFLQPRAQGNFSNHPILRLAQLLTLPHPFLFTTTVTRAFAHSFPLVLLSPARLWCFPVWPCGVWRSASSSWGLWVTNYLFKGNCRLIHWPHHTCIKKISGTFQNTNPCPLIPYSALLFSRALGTTPKLINISLFIIHLCGFFEVGT